MSGRLYWFAVQLPWVSAYEFGAFQVRNACIVINTKTLRISCSALTDSHCLRKMGWWERARKCCRLCGNRPLYCKEHFNFWSGRWTGPNFVGSRAKCKAGDRGTEKRLFRIKGCADTMGMNNASSLFSH